MPDWQQIANSEEAKQGLAGALGGIARWLTIPLRWTQGLAAVAVGAICAMFLGPLAVALLDKALGGTFLQALATPWTGAFVAGVGGLSLIGTLVSIFRVLERRTKK